MGTGKDVTIQLKGYVPPRTCPRCKRQHDAGMFLVHSGDSAAFTEAKHCRSCTGFKANYVPGMYVREMTSEGAPATWQQHERSGKSYGPLLPITRMEFRLMQDGFTVRPQANLQAGRKLRDHRDNGTLELGLDTTEPRAKEPVENVAVSGTVPAELLRRVREEVALYDMTVSGAVRAGLKLWLSARAR